MVATFKGTLKDVKKLTDDVSLLKFSLDHGVDFVAGQYLVLKVPHKDTTFRKMFSIASNPDKTTEVEMIVKFYPNGVASTYLKNLKIKDVVEFEGPDGLFVMGENDKEKLFVALGAGIAPIRSILESSMDAVRSNVTLLWGLKSEDDAYLLDELAALKDKYPENFEYFVCLSQGKGDGDRMFKGRVTDWLEKNLAMDQKEALNEYEYYLCGEDNIVHSLRVWLEEKGVEDDNMILEQFN